MSPQSQDRWSWLGVVAAALLGLVLLVAAYAKAIDPLAFAEQIRAEGLDFLLGAGTVAWIAIVLEVVLGLALVLAVRRRWVLVPTGLLIVLFLFLTGRTYWRFLNGIEPDSACGCFGNLVERSPAEAFWQDLLLLVPPFVAACFWRGPSATARWKVALVALTGIAMGIFVWRAPDLPLDDLATRLKPGVEIDSLCAGSTTVAAERACLDLIAPELTTGRHLVVIAELDSPDLAEHVADLNALAGSGPHKVWLLDDAEEEERTAFFWQHAPAFELREVPLALLRPLYRVPPRSFAVEDGKVTATWTGYPDPGAL